MTFRHQLENTIIALCVIVVLSPFLILRWMDERKTRTVKATVDVIFISAIGVAIFIALFVVTAVWVAFSTSTPVANLFQTTPQGQIALTSTNNAISILDNAAAFLYIFAMVGAVIAAAFTESSPAFAILGIIIFPIEIGFSFILHDLFYAVIANSFLSSVTSAFPYVLTLMQYFPVAGVGIWAVIMIMVVYMK